MSHIYLTLATIYDKIILRKGGIKVAKVDIDSVPDITFINPNDDILRKIQICIYAKSGVKQTDIASRYNMNRRTIQRLEKSLEDEGVKGLIDKPRPGRPVSLTDDEKVMAIKLKALDGSMSCRAIAERIFIETNKIVSHKTIEVLLKNCSLITHHGKGVKKTRNMNMKKNQKNQD